MSSRVSLQKKMFPSWAIKVCRSRKIQDKPHHEKIGFFPMQNQRRSQLRSNGEADFASRIVQFLLCLYPKCQPSSLFLRLNRLVCVRPGGKPRRPGFSLRGSDEVVVCFPVLIGSVLVLYVLLSPFFILHGYEFDPFYERMP